jgi:bacteriorhodopsin
MEGSTSPNGSRGAVLTQPLIWVFATAAAAALSFLVANPRPCNQVDVCRDLFKAMPSTVNQCIFCGLFALFWHELIALYLHQRSARPLLNLITGLREFSVAPALLCVTFAVLMVENLILMSPWAVHLAHAGSDEKPVFTMIYVEWLITVPVLLVLAGRCGISMKLSQLTLVVIITNVYILLAWLAHFMISSSMRWTMVCMSFALYGFVSIQMVKWVLNFFRSTPQDYPSRIMKACLTLGLILIFGIYGVVYLAGRTRHLSIFGERAAYTVMDASSKLIFSMGFAGIRSHNYHMLLVDMLVNANHPFQRQMSMGHNLGDPLLNGGAQHAQYPKQRS